MRWQRILRAVLLRAPLHRGELPLIKQAMPKKMAVSKHLLIFQQFEDVDR
jgi:hypothetical protein